MSRKKKPTAAARKEELAKLYDFARTNVEPQLRQSEFMMLPMIEGCEDLGMALQVGLCLLLDKPLIIIALKGLWIPPRLRALAEAVVEGDSVHDPQVRAAMQAAVHKIMQKERPI